MTRKRSHRWPEDLKLTMKQNEVESDDIAGFNSSAGQRRSAQLPLLLANSGNPADATPGNGGEIVPIRGFAPGTSEDDIREQLGEPTQESSPDGFYTSTYALIPNRATLGYVYNEDSDRVQQSEAAFFTQL